MSIDTTISLALAIIGLAYAFVGVLLTMHPPNSRRAKIGYYTVFVALSVVTLTLVWAQAARSADAQARIERIQNENAARLNRANAEIAQLQRELPPQVARSGSDIAGAIRGLNSEPSEADRAARKALHKELVRFLERGQQHRDKLIDLLDYSPEKEQELPAEFRAISKWDAQLAEYVRLNLGDERARWIRARLPSDSRAPGGLGGRKVDDAWRAVNSNMTKIEQLLSEYPEL
ncbi:MAG TPA: hypothetical protein VGQ36_28290 [Thermoanaerobaculia bacterium]|jgi:hypothetical protein|nr:hypothetical protein [Thermoanaerobaculia bacterium]